MSSEQEKSPRYGSRVIGMCRASRGFSWIAGRWCWGDVAFGADVCRALAQRERGTGHVVAGRS
jgi:hypothetical protein